MLASFLRWLGYGLCHQLPERSFFGGGTQLPVCARDTGIYVGFIVAVALIVVLDRGRRSSDVPPVWLGATLGVGFAAMAIDGVTQLFGFRESTNSLRLATGLAMGFAMAAYTVPILNSQLWRRPGSGRVLSDTVSGLIFLAGLPTAFALLWWGGPHAGIVYPLFTGVAIVATFALVNLVLVVILPPFEQRASSLRDTWLPVALAVIAAFAELAAAGYIRGLLLGLAGVVS